MKYLLEVEHFRISIIKLVFYVWILPLLTINLASSSENGVFLKLGTERNGMENGMEQKTKWNFLRKTKYMNFVDTTAYKGKWFEIKQNVDF